MDKIKLINEAIEIVNTLYALELANDEVQEILDDIPFQLDKVKQIIKSGEEFEKNN